MPKPPATTAPQLICEGCEIKQRIATDTARLKEIAAVLASKLPAGKHEGDFGTTCTIVEPSASVKPSEEEVTEVREIVGDETFKKLFLRAVSFSPVKSFREVLAALVSEKRLITKVLNLVEKPSTAYVKWG